MANYAMDHSGRQVDWLHLAGPRYLRSEDDRFFEPLRDLEPRTPASSSGSSCRSTGSPGCAPPRDRSRYLDDFGVAMYCGFGRQPGQDGMETMREHARVVRAACDAAGDRVSARHALAPCRDAAGVACGLTPRASGARGPWTISTVMPSSVRDHSR